MIQIPQPHLSFSTPNPWQTLEAIKVGYHVITMAGDPADLKGKVPSYPSHTALAACIMPQYYLHQHGINLVRDIMNHYVGSQELSIMNGLGKTNGRK